MTDQDMIGLNPENLSLEILATRPKGSRLLECEEEWDEFRKEDRIQVTLYSYCLDRWISKCTGNNPDWTYLTTRPRGWWKKHCPHCGKEITLARS